MNCRIIAILVIALAGHLVPLCAQDKDWAPVGTRWYYNQYLFFQGVRTHVIEVTGDTIISGKRCQIIENTRGCNQLRLRYAYREDRRIHYFNELTQSFQLLYDFNLEAGDTLKMYVEEEQYHQADTFYLRIDSVSYELINNDTIQIQHTRNLFELNPLHSFGEKIYEDIGGDDFFLPVYAFCDPPPFPLRCFEHPNRGLFRIKTDVPCDYVPVREAAVDDSVIVYPNPVTTELKLTVPSGRWVTHLEIFNLQGHNVYQNKEVFNNKITIDLPELMPGVYWISITFSDGTFIRRKFLRH